MKVYTADTLAAEYDPNSYTEGWNKGIEAVSKAYPIVFLTMSALTYDTKSNQYVGTFDAKGDQTLKLKLTDEVAEFLAVNKQGSRGQTGMIFLKMEKGAVTDAVVIFY